MQRDLFFWEKAGTLASSTFTCVLPLPFILPSLGAHTLFPQVSKKSGGNRKTVGKKHCSREGQWLSGGSLLDFFLPQQLTLGPVFSMYPSFKKLLVSRFLI